VADPRVHRRLEEWLLASAHDISGCCVTADAIRQERTRNAVL
jgi:hypothetical protein